MGLRKSNLIGECDGCDCYIVAAGTLSALRKLSEALLPYAEGKSAFSSHRIGVAVADLESMVPEETMEWFREKAGPTPMMPVEVREQIGGAEAEDLVYLALSALTILHNEIQGRKACIGLYQVGSILAATMSGLMGLTELAPKRDR